MNLDDYRVKIIQDEVTESPREWDNLGTMVCWHRRYDLGDEQPCENAQEYLRSMAVDYVGAYDGDLIPEKDIQRILDKHFLILPLYLYDHSGLSISTGAFSCSWDSGQVGYIYVEKTKAIEECGDLEIVKDQLLGEVKTYDQYLDNDIWGFAIEKREHCNSCDHDEWEYFDSCCGFYGSDPKENGMLDDVDKELHDLFQTAHENILSSV